MADKKDETIWVLKSNRGTYLNNRSKDWSTLGPGCVMCEEDMDRWVRWFEEERKDQPTDEKRFWPGITWKKIKLVESA